MQQAEYEHWGELEQWGGDKGSRGGSQNRRGKYSPHQPPPAGGCYKGDMFKADLVMA